MTLMIGWSLIVVLALTGFLGPGNAATAASNYTIQDIGVLVTSGTVEDLTNDGQIVGTAPVSLTRNNAWWFDGKMMIDLGACNGSGCRVMGINSNSQFVGNIGRDAFIYSNGKFIDISLFADLLEWHLPSTMTR